MLISPIVIAALIVALALVVVTIQEIFAYDHLPVAQNVGHSVQPVSDEDWKQYAEACLTHCPVLIPAIAAVIDSDVPAKPKVRVWALAQEFGVSSKHLREILSSMGVETKSPSSTVTEAQAAQVREWFSTVEFV